VVGTLDGHVILYEFKEQSILHLVDQLEPNIGSITSVSIGPDADSIAFSSERGSVMLWSHNSGATRVLATFPPGRSSVAIEGSGNLVAIASLVDEGPPHSGVIDLQRGGTLTPFVGMRAISGLEFDLHGTRLAAKSDASSNGKWSAYIWDKAARKVVLELRHESPILSAHFDESGLYLATSSLDYKARVWDLSTGQATHTFSGHTYDVNSARLSPDGSRLVTASSDRTVRLWDVQTETTIMQISPGREANDAVFTKDGNHIVVTTAGGEIVVYDVSWSSKIDKGLKDRVCNQKLPPNGKDQCHRVGPFSIEFWTQWFVKYTAAVDLI
jgi:WD40 repeat protein